MKPKEQIYEHFRSYQQGDLRKQWKKCLGDRLYNSLHRQIWDQLLHPLADARNMMIKRIEDEA